MERLRDSYFEIFPNFSVMDLVRDFKAFLIPDQDQYQSL